MLALIQSGFRSFLVSVNVNAFDIHRQKDEQKHSSFVLSHFYNLKEKRRNALSTVVIRWTNNYLLGESTCE